MNKIIRLKPVVMDYDWGNTDFIPSLLGKEKTDTPQAELWMGCHKLGCCTLEDGTLFSDFLDANPEFAGTDSGSFPYLFKILAIAKPLSIQCHPSKEQAQAGFAAGNPNYTDPNEKAEMFYALTECSLLCGLRKTPLHDEETEALHAALETFFPGDPATEYAYRLNIMHLEPGDAIFIKPGILHAYLSGNGIELMTNSDNVLRAGLTAKLVDKEELAKIMISKPFEPDLLGSLEDEGGEHFFTPAGFELTVMKDGFFRSSQDSVRLMVCTEGKAVINDDFVLEKGQVCAIAKGLTADVETDGSVFCASM